MERSHGNSNREWGNPQQTVALTREWIGEFQIPRFRKIC